MPYNNKQGEHAQKYSFANYLLFSPQFFTGTTESFFLFLRELCVLIIPLGIVVMI